MAAKNIFRSPIISRSIEFPSWTERCPFFVLNLIGIFIDEKIAIYNFFLRLVENLGIGNWIDSETQTHSKLTF